MDFFERWFGASPDGGDGTTELAWIGVLLLVLVVYLFRRPLLARLERRGVRRRDS